MIISGRQLIDNVRAKIKEVSISHIFDVIDNDIILIDIREPDEWGLGSIKEALKIPRGVLETKLHEIPKVAQRLSPLESLAGYDIYLICRSGARSVLAAESLQRLGYTKVYSVSGGFEAWKGAGYPVSYN